MIKSLLEEIGPARTQHHYYITTDKRNFIIEMISVVLFIFSLLSLITSLPLDFRYQFGGNLTQFILADLFSTFVQVYLFICVFT